MWNVWGAKSEPLAKYSHKDTIVMDDGGTISIEWALPTKLSSRHDHVCIVFPGLSGHSRKNYVSSLVRYMSEERGFKVGVFHHRGVA